MDRRDFFKKTNIVALVLIFAPAVAKVLVEDIPEIKYVWAFVTRNGVTKYYTPGDLPPDWATDYQMVYHSRKSVILTGPDGLVIIKKAVEHDQVIWFRTQNVLENEK